ncbi:MAG: hypothetical protein D6732_15030 [Methanobacteriota archaeon]|nr:MAG: hypothetical protein D6732_15030 [Euryarchaeota archaeon]
MTEETQIPRSRLKSIFGRFRSLFAPIFAYLNPIFVRLKPIFIRLKSVLISLLTSPTTIWFASLYLFSLLAIIIFNFVRTGYDIESIGSAPNYYASLFLHYGLNARSTYDSPIAEGIMSWIFTPFLVVFLGLALFFIKEAGWAYNSPYFDFSQINKTYAFFSHNVFGYEVIFFGQKGNAFFIGMVWLPIIAASVVTIMYKLHTKRETWIVTRFAINLLISFKLGMEMAKMTDPNLHFNWNEFIPTLIEHRYTNNFVVFSGHYHPFMMMVLLTFVQIVPMIVLGLMEGGYKSLKIYLQKREIFKSDDDKTVQISTQSLPWMEEFGEEIYEEE